MDQTLLHPKGNPQGKGQVGIIADWDNARPLAHHRAENPEAFLVTYWLSQLVLSSRFSHRIVPHRTYYLYWSEKGWLLSLISPREWRDHCPGEPALACVMHHDMTWHVDTEADCQPSSAVYARLQQTFDAFLANQRRAERIEEGLPLFEASLPYQQRMLATGLSVALRQDARRWDATILEGLVASANTRLLGL